MIDEHTMERLRKIRALAEEGTAGEKENARRLLDRLMLEHGLVMSELDDSEEILHEVSYKGHSELFLLTHIAWSVHGTLEVKAGKVPGTSTKWACIVTAAQAVRIDFLFGIYRVALKETIDDASRAFVAKNRIYGSDAKALGGDPRADNIRDMMAGIDSTDTRDALGKPSPNKLRW